MEELEFIKLLKSFWKEKIKIIIIVTIFLIIGVIYSYKFVTPQYEASARLLFPTDLNSENVEKELSSNIQLMTTYAEIVKSDNVIKKVASKLNIEEVTIKSGLWATPTYNTEILEIYMSTEEPEMGIKIVNEIINVFKEEVKKYYETENISVIQETKVDKKPHNINHGKDILKFVFIGIVLAVSYVLVINMFDIKSIIAEFKKEN